jgi:uncharacterized protein YndB with AHSA1/START domain
MEKPELKAEKGQPFIVMTRIIDAPRETVFRAFIDPDLVKQWWAGRAYAHGIYSTSSARPPLGG